VVDVLAYTLTPGQRAVLTDFADRLRAHFGDRLERVVIFGSRARGDVHEESDIDVLVLVREPLEAEGRASSVAWQLLADATKAATVYVPVSLIVFAEERFSELKRRERRFALDIEKEGIRL
jgi:uncharacterized protein